MTARTAANGALPRSHVFITVAYGRSARTLATRSGLAAAAAIVVPLLALWFLGSTFFLVFHDDLVTTLMLRERDMQYGYEDRIATLRSQLDREATRQLVSQRSVETKLDELAQREAELQARSGIVARLEGQVSGLADMSSAPRLSGSGLSKAAPIEFSPPSAANFAAPGSDHAAPTRILQAKPHPEAAELTAPKPDGDVPQHAGSTPERLSVLSTGLDSIETSQQDQVENLDSHVREAVARYHDALAAAGLTEGRLSSHSQSGSGGPFVPLTQVDDGSPFARAATGLQLNLSQAQQLSDAIRHVPFNRPLEGDPEITSPFGPRIDPFLGKAALHTGIDLSEDTGTEVHATAPGRVTVAGSASGYGTMVEVDHGAGLVTRYAHLSEADVSVGQSVKLGEILGRVGSTGRATGPHLHYETRIDGEPVDPLRFMAAGQRLQASADAAH